MTQGLSMKQGIVLILCLFIFGCGRVEPSKNIVVQINDYQVTAQEFEEGFAASPFAAQADKVKARQDYLNSIIDQKLILQDAQKNNLDKDEEFLKSIEHFWEQSLLTVALKVKGDQIAGSLNVSDDQIRKLYEEMIKDGVTTKSYEELYVQIKWMAAKQIEQKKFEVWVEEMRKRAHIKVNDGFLKTAK